MKKILAVIIGSLVLTSCRSSHMGAVLPPAPVVLNNVDSVSTTTKIENEMVAVDVEADIPQQFVTNIVDSDTSYIETDVARSSAFVRPDGSLYHTLTNKRVKIHTQAFVPKITTSTDISAIRQKEIPVPQPYPVYVEKNLTKAQQFKLSAFWYMACALLAMGIYIFRKPLTLLIRKIIKV